MGLLHVIVVEKVTFGCCLTLTNSFVEEIEDFGQLGPAKLVFGFGDDVIDSTGGQIPQGVGCFDRKLR